MNIVNIIENIIEQARNGKIVIGKEDNYWQFFVRFYCNIENKTPVNSKYPVININDYQLFLKEVKDYLKEAYKFYYNDKEYFDLDDKTFLQKLFCDLMINVTSYDMNNVYRYIEERKSMLLDKTIEPNSYLIGNFENKNIECKIVKNSSNIEAPYKMKLYLNDGIDIFELPSITFGIINDKVYLKCIQNKKEKQDNVLAKKMDRYFRKMNKGVDENLDIHNISTNALASLTIFNSFMRKKGIKNIEASDFLPVRYNSSKVILMNKCKKKSLDFKQYLQQIDRDQYNMTNKLMYILERYSYHFQNCECNYDDIRGVMELELNEYQNNSNIIFDLDKSVMVNKKRT